MLPAGEPIDGALSELAPLLSRGDTVVDGANGDFRDAGRRAAVLDALGIRLLDAGVSGGVWGLENGYCLMVGGDEEGYRHVLPLLETLAPAKGVLHCGPHGAGHYVKMVHNAIEYGMMQAMAEGLELLQQADSDRLPEAHRLPLNVPDITEAWRRGSVVASWLLDLTAQALAADGELSGYSGRVGDSGEGRWAVQAAIESAVPAPVLSAALYARFRSRQDGPFADRSLSAMRNAFGGHLEPK
jgi:6-phosphogluconate dehydrogenase